MKKFKKFILPAVVVLMGAGAAFATNAAKVSDSSSEDGYYFDNTTDQCEMKRSDCSHTGIIAYTWVDNNKTSHDLYELSGTSCVRLLFEPEQ